MVQYNDNCYNSRAKAKNNWLEVDMQINEVIRKYRKENNLTQEEVANRLGVSTPAVNKWESGVSHS